MYKSKYIILGKCKVQVKVNKISAFQRVERAWKEWWNTNNNKVGETIFVILQ